MLLGPPAAAPNSALCERRLLTFAGGIAHSLTARIRKLRLFWIAGTMPSSAPIRYQCQSSLDASSSSIYDHVTNSLATLRTPERIDYTCWLTTLSMDILHHTSQAFSAFETSLVGVSSGLARLADSSFRPMDRLATIIGRRSFTVAASILWNTACTVCRPVCTIVACISLQTEDISSPEIVSRHQFIIICIIPSATSSVDFTITMVI